MDRLTIEDFLKLEECAVKYDFSNDGANEKYCKLNDMDKFFTYQAVVSGEAKNEENIVKHPDSKSRLLQNIYKVLWDVEKYPDIKDKKNKITGETLNSVNTTLKELKLNGQRMYIKLIVSEYKKLIESEYKNNSEILEKISATKGLKEFVNSYHTIGNFMPVPIACNGPRGRSKVQDYWDLTLLHIYKYYTGDEKNKDNEIGYIMSDLKKEDYKDWLNRFGKGQDGWYNFVKKNYLFPFVDTKSYDYFPKELWNGHFNCDVHPKGDQIIEYFVNAQACILERGILMVKELSNRINNSEYQ